MRHDAVNAGRICIRWQHGLWTYAARCCEPLRSKQCVMANLIGRKQQWRRKRESETSSPAFSVLSISPVRTLSNHATRDFHIALLHALLATLALNTPFEQIGLTLMCPQASHFVIRPHASEHFFILCGFVSSLLFSFCFQRLNHFVCM